MRKTTISDFMSPHSASDKPFNVMGKFNPTTNKIELYPGAVADTLPTESTRAVVGEINPLTGGLSVGAGERVSDLPIRNPKFPAQRSLRFRPQYTLVSTPTEYVTNYSTGSANRIIQEEGFPFLLIRYRGAINEVRWEFLAENGTTGIANQYRYVVGSDAAEAAQFVTPFAGDEVVKEIVLIFGALNINTTGAVQKNRFTINTNTDFRVGSFKLEEVKYGFLNSRHVYFEDSASPLGYKSYSFREGNVASLWYRDGSWLDTLTQRMQHAVSMGCTAVRFTAPYKAGVWSDLSVNEDRIMKFTRALDMAGGLGLRAVISLNHGFNDLSRPDDMVYPDQIQTEEARIALAARCGAFLSLIGKHPAIAAIEIQNEANLFFLGGTRTAAADFTVMWDYYTRIAAEIRAHTDAGVLFSVSNAGASANLAAAAKNIADIVDVHNYGRGFEAMTPANVTLISHESGSIADMNQQQYSAETIGVWWQFVNPANTNPSYDAAFEDAFADARPGQKHFVPLPQSGIYCEAVTTLSQVGNGVPMVYRYNPATSGETAAWRRIGGTWTAVTL